MSEGRGVEAILNFQDYQAAKGLLAKSTAQSRKAALGKVLGILDGEEAKDVTALDLDDLMRRFSNLEGKNYKPDSLRVYKSRISSAITDFENYLENPLEFRPSVNRRATRKNAQKKKETNKSEEKVDAHTKGSFPPHDAWSSQPNALSPSILPIPLRADLVVRIQGIPFDLTEAEAKKIANVVMAMATP